MDIMTALFDEEEVSRRYRLRIEREKAEKIARNLIADGNLSYDRIANCTGLTINEVEELDDLALA